MYKRVPTYDVLEDRWTYADFESREEYLDFLYNHFKKPGEYGFDETSFLFNKESRRFLAEGVYCLHPVNSSDYKDYWDFEKEKCRNGVLFKKGDKSWFLTRDYYFLLNFLNIYNKERKCFSFPDVRDAQYHLALYEEIAEHSFKHCAILKKRQMLSSYFHAGKLINRIWFEAGYIAKLAASHSNYVSGTWSFVEEHRNFLNTHTAWYRSFTPDKIHDWRQAVEIKQDGRKKLIGLKSILKGLVLDKNPTFGVGGPTNIFFYDEAGIAPRMNETVEFLFPALKSGELYTGMFVAAGSVGELKSCEPLQDMILYPDSYDVLAVETDLYDDSGQVRVCGLFIPEQWSMPPYIDEYGNSKVEEALEAIIRMREVWKKQLRPDMYQLRVSQHPINIQEAFAIREDSVFPLHLVAKQMQRIKNSEYFLEYVDLRRDDQGKIEIVPSKRVPIMEFPINPNLEDKEGVIVMHERPVENPRPGMYYASIDPVAKGQSKESNSLASIYIYKNDMEVVTIKADGTKEHEIKPGKLVCWWTGRFDDLNKTHERFELMIDLYNATTVIENNVSLFIQYMQFRNKQHCLVQKRQLAFVRDLEAKMTNNTDYGWRNTGDLFNRTILPYLIQFVSESLYEETTNDGKVVKTVYGIERIPDIMLLKEMSVFSLKRGNYDRIIAFGALCAFLEIQKANRGIIKKVHVEDKDAEVDNHIQKMRNPFKNISTYRKIHYLLNVKHLKIYNYGKSIRFFR